VSADGFKGGYDVYKGPKNLDPAITSAAQWPVNEPLAVIPAMAAVTKNLGFGVTVATTYEQPYHLARRLSTIDHLTKGRLGWNVSSYCILSNRIWWLTEYRSSPATSTQRLGISAMQSNLRSGIFL
jgi:hypothetical protein